VKNLYVSTEGLLTGKTKGGGGETQTKKPSPSLFTECLLLQAGSTCFSTGQGLEAVTAILCLHMG